MLQIDGRQNPKLQSIRLDKFPIKCAKIISKQEILATSDFPWFYSYDIEYGTIKRFPHIRGAQMRHLRGFYAAYGSKFLAFPDNGGKIAIVSGEIFYFSIKLVVTKINSYCFWYLNICIVKNKIFSNIRFCFGIMLLIDRFILKIL